MSNMQLSNAVSENQLFVVFWKNGQRQFVLAESEQDLPGDHADIAFAASLSEMKSMVSEMEQVMSTSVDDSESTIALCA